MSMFSTLRPDASQNVSVGAASAASTAFGAQTRDIRVVSTVACYIRIGAGTPTAVATDTLLPANVPEYFHTGPGEKIACLQVSTGGTLNVTEMTR